MNERILELIKNPESFENNDLDMLDLEIKKIPYAQSIRSLYLYGVHKHKPENYQTILSETAAYTTDKKILYQFINKTRSATHENTELEHGSPEPAQPPITRDETSLNEIASLSQPIPKPVYVNGELNRILFEGEEDFLSAKSPVIDLETTKESGVIVTQSSDQKVTAKTLTPVESPQEEAELPTAKAKLEIIKQEDSGTLSNNLTEALPSTEPKEQAISDAKVNFHGTEEFLPDVKVGANKTPLDYKVPTALPSRHELEMQRLIADVEAKIKNRKKQPEPEEEPVPAEGLDFADVQDFTVENINENNSAADTQTEDFAIKNIDKEEEPIAEKADSQSAPQSYSEERTWTPMRVSAAKPDSLMENSKENHPLILDNAPHQATEPELARPNEPIASAEKEAFDISFFTQTATSPETKKADELLGNFKNNVEHAEDEEESNVPVFINTWQNWLKLDRNTSKNEEIAAISKEAEKVRVIETFISKEPKISKLKDETDFVVKDRGDNISHLMTETLAKLYTDQKLYAKAIKAYQILSEKHPAKKSYFHEQIQAVKDLRQSKQP